MQHAKKGEKIRLHRLLLGAKDGDIVDHANRDKLDNRKQNLRIATPSENTQNSKISKKNKTGFIGVWWDKDRKKWEVQIRLNGKSKKIGRFTNLEKAIKARLEAELEYFGEDFAPQRHLFKEYGIY